MFTGLVEGTGRLSRIEQKGGSALMVIRCPELAAGIRVGDSVAVNGTCLTAVWIRGEEAAFEAVPETLRMTTLGDLRPGARVNLERALALGDRLGGHLVAGHIDGRGMVRTLRKDGSALIAEFEAPLEIRRYLVHKGSVAIDGVSLTVAGVLPDGFTVSLIPHTMERTTLSGLKVGDAVNLEADMLAKYVERLLFPPEAVSREESRPGAGGRGREPQSGVDKSTAAGSLTGEFLRSKGF
ncbi:MAG: riboflavin synthase [Firmicutes bacterium]|nr:riboflavin synthase [Bacillota bacterium]